ncbi:hypothetical protein HPB47_021579 [Ixodes persulcatus]|uniref:Uncharacterized protein n=1 Tax=Ixodes persulcatus TaxID=34615 RepID=A0AC60QC33_IXOPE|nr:hypothetical protein HPB47_021579 [Ixodes persulcatus]
MAVTAKSPKARNVSADDKSSQGPSPVVASILTSTAHRAGSQRGSTNIDRQGGAGELPFPNASHRSRGAALSALATMDFKDNKGRHLGSPLLFITGSLSSEKHPGSLSSGVNVFDHRTGSFFIKEDIRLAPPLSREIRNIQNARNVRYTDATRYLSRLAMAISVIDAYMQEITSRFVSTSSPLEAEEAAIALAITSTSTAKSLAIIIDSQVACCSFGKGRLSEFAHRILTTYPSDQLPTVSLIWTPRHDSFSGNELAHASARALTTRAPPPQGNPLLIPASPLIINPTPEQWEAARSSSDPHDQPQLVSRARRAAKATGALD